VNSGVFYGDAERVLKTLPPGIAQCCVTSPPYWGLRDYSVEGQFGLEKTIDEYIERMVGVFKEVWRVLRGGGTVWLNLGDCYASTGNKSADPRDRPELYGGGCRSWSLRDATAHPKTAMGSLKPKDLCMIPARVALALQADGWWLRSDIIWSKPNPMPESCTDRPTTAHEHLFLLSKRPRYFYDADAIREAQTSKDNSENPNSRSGVSLPGYEGFAMKNRLWNPAGRNKRTVWEIATAPYPGAHFATFSPALVEPCILAGTSPRACEICGAPWKRLTERKTMIVRNGPKSGGYGSRTTDSLSGTMLSPAQVKTTGWQPTCSCDNEGKGRCLVLDPFAGSGTTGEVALKHGRDYLLIELNRDYEKLIRGRLGLFYAEAEVAMVN